MPDSQINNSSGGDMKKIGFFGFLLLGLIVCSLSIATGVSAAELQQVFLRLNRPLRK